MKRLAVDGTSHQLNYESLLHAFQSLGSDGAILFVTQKNSENARQITQGKIDVEWNAHPTQQGGGSHPNPLGKVTVNLGINIAVSTVEYIASEYGQDWVLLNRHGIFYSRGDGSANTQDFPREEITKALNINL